MLILVLFSNVSGVASTSLYRLPILKKIRQNSVSQ